MSAEYQRDVVIEELRRAAQRDKDIYFVSPDFGAPALDAFRAEFPGQFLDVGVSEQNLVDLAAGLALAGKRVFVYAMAPFLSTRSLEQIKCSVAAMELPVTFLSIGGGLGYAESGPTHHATEELACLRALGGIEILTPCDAESAREMALLALRAPAFRVLRLDRLPLPPVYRGEFSASIALGYREFGAGRICIATCGYLIHRALRVRDALGEEGIEAAVIDLFRVKPIDESLGTILRRAGHIVSLEEQRLAGGFGSAILEYLSDHALAVPVTRLGVPDRCHTGNGSRDHLLEEFGLGEKNLVERIRRLASAA